MLKKLLFLLLSMNLFAFGNDQPKSMSSTTKIIYGVGGTVAVVSGVIAAPLVLPAGTIVIIQTATATAATQIIAYITNLSLATKIGLGISGAYIVRPYVIQTTEEKLAQFNKSEAAELLEEKNKLSKCLVKNKANSQKGSLGCPLICQDTAYAFALIAGQNELDRMLSSTK